MVKVIIVDTLKLPYGIGIAKQLRNISERYDEIDLEIECIFRYYDSYLEIPRIREANKKSHMGIEIRPITLDNYFETLDEYYNNENGSYVFLIHYASGDVSNHLHGLLAHPSKRASVRYVKNHGCPDNIWLYTGSALTLREVAVVHTNNHVLDYCGQDEQGNFVLDVESNEIFMNQLRQKNKSLIKKEN